MTNDEKTLLLDFQKETLDLIQKMELILEQCEDDIRLASGLEEYGQLVDRIMGGSQSLVMGLEARTPVIPVLEQIGNYSGVCKAVGYKTSQLTDRQEFYDICVAFLMDATEILQEMTNTLSKDLTSIEKYTFNETFINRLKWVSEQFVGDFRSSVAVRQNETAGRMDQDEIDNLLKKLGL